jgi:S-adenosyl methyltransferase
MTLADQRRSGENLGRDSRTSPSPDHPHNPDESCADKSPASVKITYWLEEALRQYEASGAVPYRTRSLEEFTGYFDGLELVEPGVVLVADWRPHSGASRGPEIPQVGAVGRKR